MNISEEVVLIKDFKKGNLKAFELLVLNYQQKIYNFALFFSEDQKRALEMCENIFCDCFNNIKKYNKETPFLLWLYKIAIKKYVRIDEKLIENLSNDINKKQTDDKEDLMSQIRINTNLLGPEDHDLRVAFTNAIIYCINKLDKHLKLFVVLKDFQNLSYTQIAGILNVESNIVKVAVIDARKKFEAVITKNKDLFLTKKIKLAGELIYE